MELSSTARPSPPPAEDGQLIDVQIVVEPPPEVPKAQSANVLTRLLPVAMIVAMGGMTVLYFTSGAGTSRSPMFLFFPVMMLMSVLGSLAYGARGTRRSGELDEDRRAYLRYLRTLDDSLGRSAEAQYAAWHWRHPDPVSAWTLVGGARMWERRKSEADFCHVRVGIGPAAPAATLVLPEPGPIDGRDPVTAGALARVIAERATVPGMPITVDLTAHRVIAVEGTTDRARAMARAMVCQAAVLQGPDDLGFTGLGEASAREWDWLKWLPHHRRSVEATPSAHLVVIVDGEHNAGELGAASETAGVTMLCIGRHGSVPCLSIDVDADTTIERPDTMTHQQALACARRLAPFVPRSAVGGGPIDWAGLVGIDDPARIDAATAWAARVDRHRLRVAVGTAENGEPVWLDLKEAAEGGMGPHGLCVGATGSGKSEFLRTLALGLVATHAPDALNLVLVDFKGGATFLGLERLRHVAAVVTNLADEEHLVVRMRDALAGEMTRRQEVLRAAGNFANIGEYAAARGAGADLPPLPALLIVVDEFAEMLSQQPDFAELFVAIGRVGRSLGVHLLLASQRLDEGRLRGLESHLSYRICLKTFSAAESRAVLGTSDAHDLPASPGAAILKTAAGDVVRFQTAYVSGPVPTPEPPAAPVPALFRAAQPSPTRRERVGARPLLDAVVDGLACHGLPAHRVWLPPLEQAPTIGALLGATDLARPPLVLPIGLVDNPFSQRREQLLADLRAVGGHVAVVGGPRAGKSTTLQTLLLALAATSDPGAVQIYGLDFGGGGLCALSDVPHVGAVAGRFERELAKRILTHVQGLVADRDARRRRGAVDDSDGEAFLVIDGWAVARQELDGVEEVVTAIAAQGLSAGVHIVIAASRWADIRPALKDQLGTRIELRLGDPADSEMDRRRARLLGDRPPGHGITRDGLEFVVAAPRLGVEDLGSLRADVESLRTRHAGRAVPPIRLLPSRVSHPAVAAERPDALCIGLGEHDMQPLAMDFGAHHHLLVLGDAECGKTAALRTLCREIVRVNGPDCARILVVDFRRTLLGEVESDHLLGYAASAAVAETHVTAAVALLSTRLPGEHVTQRQLRDRSWWSGPDVYVMVDDYDLVAGASGNPLSPLLDLLPHARDIGLHMVIARRSGGAARALFDPVLSRLRDLGCMGLMMSASPDEGALLGSARPTPLPPGRGRLSRRGERDQLVQVSWVEQT